MQHPGDNAYGKRPQLLIISGLTATGKTTVGKQVAALLGLPFVSKDEMKEALFEALGHSDKEWSTKLSIGCFRLLDYLMESALAAGKGLAVETNFKAQHDAERINALIARHGAQAVELVFEADPAVRIERFRKRYETGERHPGHVDALTPEIAEKMLNEKYVSVLEDSWVIRVDTTRFEAVKIDAIAQRVGSIMKS